MTIDTEALHKRICDELHELCCTMDRSELKLNDFKSFDRYLNIPIDGNSYKLFARYIDKSQGIDDPLFVVPIVDPKTIAEFQLNHYVYWMAIHAAQLKRKPLIIDEDFRIQRIFSKCFACAYSVSKYSEETKQKMIKTVTSAMCSRCPIYSEGELRCTDRSTDYFEWFNTKDSTHAFDIAHLKWHEVS